MSGIASIEDSRSGAVPGDQRRFGLSRVHIKTRLSIDTGHGIDRDDITEVISES